MGRNGPRGDHFRNGRGATANLPYSPRARAGATVALPVTWQELPRTSPTDFDVRTVPPLLAKRRIDPWADLLSEAQVRPYDFALCARVAHARNDAAAERVRLDRCLATVPTDVGSLLARARLNDQEGRLAESVADYGAILSQAPDFAAALNSRAWVEIEMGDFVAGRADADRAVALEPDSSFNLGTRCFALAGLGELAAARIDCARALELRPDNRITAGMIAFIDKRFSMHAVIGRARVWPIPCGSVS